MPIVDFDSLPDEARVWVYGADKPLAHDGEQKLVAAVDEFLSRWAAHGSPLFSSRRLDNDRFLTIAVDSTREGASGCSIDGLYRTLKSLGPSVGAGIVTSGLVYYRSKGGDIRAVSRDEFSNLAVRGEITNDTEVFDLSVTSLNEWKSRFKSRVADSWHASLLPEPSTKA